MTDLILTEPELVTLTGYRRPSDQLAELHRRGFARAVPDHTGEYRCVFHEAKPGVRGAFPVTVMDRY